MTSLGLGYNLRYCPINPTLYKLCVTKHKFYPRVRVLALVMLGNNELK